MEVHGRFEDFNAGVAPGALVGTAVRLMTSVVLTPIEKLTKKAIAEDGQAACQAAFQGAASTAQVSN